MEKYSAAMYYYRLFKSTGINIDTLKILMIKAKEKDNFMEIEYQSIDLNIIKKKY
jgi:hypothetical protein